MTLCFFCESTRALPPYTESCLRMINVLHTFEHWLPSEMGPKTSPYKRMRDLITAPRVESKEICPVVNEGDCYKHLKSHALGWVDNHVAKYKDCNSTEFKDLVAAIKVVPDSTELVEQDLSIPSAPQKQHNLIIWDAMLPELNEIQLSKVYLLLTLINHRTCPDHKFDFCSPEITATDIILCARRSFGTYFAWVARVILKRLGLYDQGLSKLYNQKLRQLAVFRDSDEVRVEVYLPEDLKSKPSLSVKKEEALEHEYSYRKRVDKEEVRVARFEKLPYCPTPISFNPRSTGLREMIHILPLSLSPDLLADLYNYFAVLNFYDPLKPGAHVRLDLSNGHDVSHQINPEHLVLLAEENGLNAAAVCQGLEVILRSVFRLVSEADSMKSLFRQFPRNPGVLHGLSEDQEDLCRMTVAVSALQRCPVAVERCIDDYNNHDIWLIEGAFVTDGRCGGDTFNALNIIKACSPVYVKWPYGWLARLLWQDSEDPEHVLASEDYGRYMMYAKDLAKRKTNKTKVKNCDVEMGENENDADTIMEQNIMEG